MKQKLVTPKCVSLQNNVILLLLRIHSNSLVFQNPNSRRFAAKFSFEGGRTGYFASQNSPFGLPQKGISRPRRVYFSKRESLVDNYLALGSWIVSN